MSRRKSSHIVQVQATTNNVERRGSVQDELPSNLGTKRNVAPTLPMGFKQSKKRTGSQPHSMFNKIHGNTWKYMEIHAWKYMFTYICNGNGFFLPCFVFQLIKI